ncbi:MAG: hypothetical protein LV481_01475 [Methylacidiphilales bacterium]|nr:hypothetical protein [Candidatus Methylacidiphilales bacterium]
MKNKNEPILGVSYKLLVAVILFNLFLAANSLALGQQTYITLTPVLKQDVPTNMHGIISFKVTNVCAKEVMIKHHLELMTEDNSRNVPIEEFRTGGPPPSWGPIPAFQLLKPGQTEIIDTNYSVETFSFLKSKGKKLFGEINGYVVDTNERFQTDSEPFFVPDNLAKSPWVDLGNQTFFSVIPVIEKITFSDVIMGGGICIPVDVKNISNSSYIVNNRIDIFCLEKVGLNDNNRKNTLLSDTIKESGSIFNPGDEVELVDRSYTTVSYLKACGYKPGDTLIAIVAGQIPGTNQVFECTSAPFVLPPFPKK